MTYSSAEVLPRGGRVSRTVGSVVDVMTRHPLLSVFVVALVARLFVALVVTPAFSGSLVLDDLTYHRIAGDYAAGDTDPWDKQTRVLFETTAAFVLPIAFIYRLVGPVMVAGQLWVVLLGSITAVLTARLMLEVTSARWAVVAGMLVALIPSQILWSSLLLKDAAVWVVLAGLGLVVAIMNRVTGRRLAIALVVCAVVLSALAFLRLHTLVVASWSVALGALFGLADDRLPRIAGAIAIAVMVPWVVGQTGPAGYTLVTDAGSLEARRLANAQGAKSAVLDVVDRPDGDGTGRGGISVLALDTDGDGDLELVPGTVASEDGSSGRIDEKIDGGDSSLNPNLLYLPRGLVVMLLEPFPVPFEGSLSLRFARAESVLWYAVLVLALIGITRVRRRFSALAFPIVVGLGILLVYALAEGNVGTAYRHRGEFVWVVALLAALGLRRLAEWRSRTTESVEIEP